MNRIKYLVALTNAIEKNEVFPIFKTKENTLPSDYEKPHERSRYTPTVENDIDRYRMRIPSRADQTANMFSILS